MQICSSQWNWKRRIFFWARGWVNIWTWPIYSSLLRLFTTKKTTKELSQSARNWISKMFTCLWEEQYCSTSKEMAGSLMFLSNCPNKLQRKVYTALRPCWQQLCTLRWADSFQNVSTTSYNSYCLFDSDFDGHQGEYALQRWTPHSLLPKAVSNQHWRCLQSSIIFKRTNIKQLNFRTEGTFSFPGTWQHNHPHQKHIQTQ